MGRYGVNNYRDYPEHQAEDTVNDLRLTAMVHLSGCGQIPENPGRWWMCFDTVREIREDFGVGMAFCGVCLPDQEPHIDPR